MASPEGWLLSGCPSVVSLTTNSNALVIKPQPHIIIIDLSLLVMEGEQVLLQRMTIGRITHRIRVPVSGNTTTAENIYTVIIDIMKPPKRVRVGLVILVFVLLSYLGICASYSYRHLLRTSEQSPAERLWRDVGNSTLGVSRATKAVVCQLTIYHSFKTSWSSACRLALTVAMEWCFRLGSATSTSSSSTESLAVTFQTRLFPCPRAKNISGALPSARGART